MFRALACLFVASFLLGCAAAPTIEYSGLDGGYTPEYVYHAAAGGRFPTKIYGQPVPGAKADSDRAVLSALQLPGHFPPAVFVPLDPANARATRLVLRFDVESGANPCDGTAVPRAARDASLSVAAALCSGEGTLSHARARAPRPRDAADPVLAASLNALLRDLMPASIRDVPDGS